MADLKENLTKLRKAKNWSQTELAMLIGSTRITVGKYERGETAPDADIIVKLTTLFDVSSDYLLGISSNPSFDKKMIQRLDDIEGLKHEDKERILYYIDLVLRDAKTRNAYSL